MKIKISKSQEPYLNYVVVHTLNLDKLAFDSSCEVIYVDAIDFVPGTAVIGIMGHWVSKLAHGGQLTIEGVDLSLLAQKVISQQVKIPEANEILFGNDQIKKNGAYTLTDICLMMQNLGLKIITKQITDMTYSVTGVRR